MLTRKRWLVAFIIFPLVLRAQVDRQYVKTIVTSNATADKNIAQFYALRDYSPAWLTDSVTSRCDSLYSLLQTAAKNGLNEQDYDLAFVKSICEKRVQPANSNDSAAAELRISSIALHFLRDLVYGNIAPGFGYDGLAYQPNCIDIPSLLNNCLESNQWMSLANAYDSWLPEINTITRQIELLQNRKSRPDFSEETITSASVNVYNRPLCKKLFFLGITDTLIQHATDREVKACLKKSQLQFDMLADGELRSTILAQLNISISARLGQLYLSLSYYRWLRCLSQEQPVIVVNIPAAYLKVYYKDSILIQMEMIVGKPSTPTPTLTSRVTEIILYPYWTVPRSIVVKELLPAFKRNPGYINSNNFQLITPGGKVADPYKINWEKVTASGFGYTVRQSTGCDNALGILKLNFNNPFGVYLHDTPDKIPFTFAKRFFSHGCMRMSDPMAIGHLILKKNSVAIDTLEGKGCLKQQSPIVVPADEKMALVVWYNPAGIGSDGSFIYYEDIYKKLHLK